MLLGLLREGDGIGAQILRNLGIELEWARGEVMRVLSIGQRTPDPAWVKDNVVTCRVDDRDLDAIDVLIESGLRGSRGDAVSWLVRAGIEANQDLFEKVYATVAEIRRRRNDVLITAISREEAKKRLASVAAVPPTSETPGASEPSADFFVALPHVRRNSSTASAYARASESWTSF